MSDSVPLKEPVSDEGPGGRAAKRSSFADDAPVRLNQLPVRWLVLTLQCLALIGSYYCYDNPTALHTKLESYFTGPERNLSKDKFNTLYNLSYTVYSIPNTVLPFFGGFLCDKLGIRMMAVVFSGLIALGQLIFAIGLTLHAESWQWPVMLAGRVVFGLGGESLSVAQSAMIAKWFVGKELAFALGMNLALARVGSVINDVASPAIAEKGNLPDALWVGFLICIVSFIATVWCFYVDKKAEKRIARNLAERGRLTGDEFAVEKEVIDFKACFRFPPVFWILTLSCLTIYCTVLPFNNIASTFIVQKWYANGVPFSDLPKSRQDHLTNKANSIMLATYLTAGLLSPPMGAVIDRIGYRAVLNVVASMLIVGVHLALRFTTWYPVFPLVVLGICYSIYAAALWPSIALVVSKDSAATAYGVVTAVQNAGLAAAPLIISRLQPPHCGKTYNCVEMFFVWLGVIGTVSGIVLNIQDRRRAVPVLNLPEAKIAKLIEETGGDLAALETQTKARNLAGGGEAGQSLLAGTPTLYDDAGGVINLDEARARRISANRGPAEERGADGGSKRYSAEI